MNLKDYILGQKLVLRSPLAPNAFADRLNRAAASLFWPFAYGPAGFCRLRRLYLIDRRSVFSGSLQPVLTGRCREAFGATEIRAHFGAPLWFLFAMLLPLGILTLITIAILLSVLRDGPQTGSEYLIIPIWAAFVAGPVLILTLVSHSAEAHLAEMLEFLELHAEAVPVSASSSLS